MSAFSLKSDSGDEPTMELIFDNRRSVAFLTRRGQSAGHRSAQGLLQRSRLFDRARKPCVPLFRRRQKHRHGLGMDRPDHVIRFPRQEREQLMLRLFRPYALQSTSARFRRKRKSAYFRRARTNASPSDCRSIRKMTLPARDSAIPPSPFSFRSPDRHCILSFSECCVW
jgi:hypothetical protein